MSGAIFAPDPIHAQGGDKDYVDVGITLEVPEHEAAVKQRLNIIVVNNGARTAYDVEVVVDIKYPKSSSYFVAQGDAVPGGPLKRLSEACLWRTTNIASAGRYPISEDCSAKL